MPPTDGSYTEQLLHTMREEMRHRQEEHHQQMELTKAQVAAAQETNKLLARLLTEGIKIRAGA